MKRHARTVLALVLAMLLLVGSLSGCGSTTPAASSEAASTSASASDTPAAEASSEAATEPAATAPSYLSDTSPITFDWYVDASWYTRAKWGVDATSKYITAKTGVTLNIILPTGNEAERKNLMIATNDVPDFVSMGFWEGARKSMVDAGLVYTLNELADQYAPDFWEQTTPSTAGWYQEADGKVYGYPCCNMPIERIQLPENQRNLLSYVGLSVRKDMYEAIGSPDMTTTDGFLAALRAAKEKFPTVDGRSLIPFTFGYEFNDQGNVAIEDQLCELLNLPMTDADGKLRNRLTDPELATWLKMFRQANQEGLLPKEVFIDKAPQFNDAHATGRVFATLFAVNSLRDTINGPLFEKDPNVYYIQIEGPQNSRKEKAGFKAGGLSGWLWTAISKTNRNPERAIKFLQYWMSEEGQADFYLGDPAVTRTEDGTALKQEVYDLRGKDETAFCDTYGNMDNYFMMLDPSITNRWLPVNNNVKPYEKQVRDFQFGRLKDATVFNGLDPVADTPAAIELGKIRSKWGTLLPKMLLAESEAAFDKLMEEYVKADEAARAVYLPDQQALYEANAKKLGQ